MSRRIRAVAVTAAVVALLVFAVPLAFAVRRVAVDDERTELQRIADRYAVTVSADAPSGHDPVELPPAEETTTLAYYDVSGHLLTGEGPSQLEMWATSTLNGELTDTGISGSLAVAVPVTDGSEVIGAVRAETDLSEANNRVWQAFAAMTAVALGAVAVATVVAGRLSRRLTRPLQKLSDDARALGDGDFTRRSTLSGIPEIDAAGKALDNTSIRLGQMIAQERAFNRIASHQLRTPLTALRLILETGRGRSPERMTAAMTDAMTAVDRLDSGIDEVLLLARSGTANTSPGNVDALSARIERDYHGLLATVGRPLRIRQGLSLPQVTMRLSTIGQVLTVLLDNALQHGRGAVEVSIRDAGGALAIDVSDFGDGFQTVPSALRLEDENRTANDPFAERTSGGGLGLPLARALADSEGGRLVLTCLSPPTVTLLMPSTGGPR